MKRGKAGIDVTGLPEFAFGNRGLMWWGAVIFIAVETTMLVICFVSYFYLRDRVVDWPPPPTALPDLLVPTLNLLVLLGSIAPMYMVGRAAKRLDSRRVLAWMAVSILFGVAFVVLRYLEFGALNVYWDTNAYGSIVWIIVGVHTFHMFAEVVETVVIALILAKGHTEPKYFVDATDNALYWYFIVGIWVPCYVIVFLAPRFL